MILRIASWELTALPSWKLLLTWWFSELPVWWGYVFSFCWRVPSPQNPRASQTTHLPSKPPKSRGLGSWFVWFFVSPLGWWTRGQPWKIGAGPFPRTMILGYYPAVSFSRGQPPTGLSLQRSSLTPLRAMERNLVGWDLFRYFDKPW